MNQHSSHTPDKLIKNLKPVVFNASKANVKELIKKHKQPGAAKGTSGNCTFTGWGD